jgi:hypothetical protein
MMYILITIGWVFLLSAYKVHYYDKALLFKVEWEDPIKVEPV